LGHVRRASEGQPMLYRLFLFDDLRRVVDIVEFTFNNDVAAIDKARRFLQLGAWQMWQDDRLVMHRWPDHWAEADRVAFLTRRPPLSNAVA
jgi:hypothetical protein